jgi:hypothetical protein
MDVPITRDAPSRAYPAAVPLPLGPLVFPHVPVAAAIAWYVVSAAVVIWVTVDAAKCGFRWGVWLLLSVVIGPVAWVAYAVWFRPRRESRTAG